MPPPAGVSGVVLDVEGTTTPISFVHETLFPFARARLARSCARAGEDQRLAAAVARLRDEHAQEAAGASVPQFGSGAPYAEYLMERDRKSTGLKALQGIIWEAGYAKGELVAPVFPDVPLALAAWRRAGLKIRIYSSGSVLAQQLLFSHTDQGDLTGYLDGYHDTTTGPKTEAESYRAIARAMAEEPERLLFLSDSAAELDAAAACGMRSGLLVRLGNAPCGPGAHPTLADFHSLI